MSWLGLHDERTAEWFFTTFPDSATTVNTTSIGRLKSVVGGTPSFFICIFGFFPFVLRFYLGREWFSYKAIGAATLVYLLVLLIGYGFAANLYIYYFQGVYALLFTILALKVSLPADSKIPRILFYQFGILGLGTGAVMLVLPWLPMSNTVFELSYYCVFLPSMREAFRYLATKCAWYMSSDANIGGSNVNVLCRQYAWVFVAHMQVFWAMYFRMAIVNMASPWMSVLVVTYQAILEVFLRLSMQYRDECIGKAKDRVQSAILGTTRGVARKTLVVPALRATVFSPSGQLTKPRTPEEIRSRKQARAMLYSMTIVTEMMAEYTGIANSAFLLWFWWEKPILYPFTWYAKHALGSELDRNTLFSTTALQFAMELLVDTVCLRFEQKTDPYAVWSSMSFGTFAALFMASAWYGSFGAISVFIQGDNFANCQDTDMCYCVNNGFVEGGVLETYCHLIYPNATWDTGSFPVLGPHVSTLN